MPALRGQAANALREIRDPNSGARWLLLRDTACPGGPGRLIEVSGKDSNGTAQPGADRTALRAVPVIRAGSRVRVEEHTAVVDAALEGLALDSAVAGASLRVRLNVGGRVVLAVALAPGHAALAPHPEVWR